MSVLKNTTDEYFGEYRLEDIISMPNVESNHKFTDNNGKFHENGYYVTNGENETLRELIIKLIEKRGYNNINLNDIDVSNIKDMSNLFSYIEDKDGKILWREVPFSCDISGWDVSSVRNMSNMFEWCKSFNQDLSKWNTKNLREASV